MRPPAGKEKRKFTARTTLNWLFRILLVGMCVVPVFGQEVKVYVSSEAGDRLKAEPPVRFEGQKKARVPLFRIMTGNMIQKIVGFGASFSDAGMACLENLPRPEQEAILRSLFDQEQGAGFSAMKTPIAARYDEVPGDIAMTHFSIRQDLGPNGLITYIKRARRYGEFVLQASMDDPPGWMLTGATRDQKFDPKYYAALAHYYLLYLQGYEQNGVFINYLSLFNEPGVYTKINYREMSDLIKDHIGPLFTKKAVRTKLQLGEAPTPDSAYRNYPTVMEDAGARMYISALACHGCDGDHFDKIAHLHHQYPGLPVLMTGVCHAYKTRTQNAVHPSYHDFQGGLFWGNMIVSALEAGASGWINGRMVVDRNGGPLPGSSAQRKPGSDLQQPIVIINRRTRKAHYTGLYYSLAHFSKFVRPGAIRVLLDGKYPGLRRIAFLSPEPDGGWHWVVELLNNRQTAAKVQVDFELDWVRRSLQLTLPAISITTCIWKPLPYSLGSMPTN